MDPHRSRRIESIDITRGLIVFLSILLFSIPIKYNGINIHANWYGFSFVDIIFPAFVTIFGTSIAIAYRKGINNKRFFMRTIKLLLYGLVFNMIVSWSLELETLRFTGVLQLFAVLGVATVVITKFIKKPTVLITLSLLIFSIQGWVLVQAGAGCGETFPGPECSPSSYIDPYVFGENHMYVQGGRGYDPEGLPSMFGALGNVLLGFAAGQFILGRKRVERKLFLYSGTIFFLFIIALLFIPIGKRMWTPSFGLLTSGITVFLLAGFVTIFDKDNYRRGKVNSYVRWFFIAFGRNSFLIYFGKYLLSSFMNNVTITVNGASQTLHNVLMNSLEKITISSNLFYTIIILGFWVAIALICHWRKWYLKI